MGKALIIFVILLVLLSNGNNDELAGKVIISMWSIALVAAPIALLIALLRKR